MAASVAVVYSVPTSFVVLLKSAYVFNSSSSTPVQAAIYIRDITPTVALAVWSESVELNTIARWDGWIALRETDQVQINAGAAGLQYWLSGALLPFAPFVQPT